MTPVFFIKGKLHPYRDRSGFTHSGYDVAEVVDDGILVHVQYDSMLSLVVTQRGKKFFGKMFIRIACQFDNEA